MSNLPPEAFACSLAALPAMGPARLATILRAWEPPEAWARVEACRAVSCPEVAAACGPDPRSVGKAWAGAARAADVGALWQAHRRAGVSVLLLGGPDYPAALAGDHEAPAVLFSLGRPDALDHRRVAIVGSRRATRYGRDLARELGGELAAAGVAVVSGLALGVDGAAHAGALSAGGAPPVGVVGSGLDVVYPVQHRQLWSQVAKRGLLLSEAPLGARPQGWRFPVRNRIIAGLAEVVVVVESYAAGGCVHTVGAACDRGRPVMAVPGSVRSPASALTNALLAEGCAPARDAVDVLVALGLSTSSASTPSETRPQPGGDAGRVLEAAGWEPATLEEIVVRSGLGPGPASTALAHLEDDGWVANHGGWWERIAGPSGHGHHGGTTSERASQT